ncbi:unnamed protein product, partial [Amoebophrya sp. A25]
MRNTFTTRTRNLHPRKSWANNVNRCYMNSGGGAICAIPEIKKAIMDYQGNPNSSDPQAA